MTQFAYPTIILLCFLALGTATCRKAETPPKPAAESAPEIAEPSPPEKPRKIPIRVEIPVPLDDASRWLFVQKAAEKAKGGWATGSFDPQRNKLRITTSDVEEFAVDAGRIKVDWQKLVVLSIDGRNSELRKRDVDVLHFVRSPHGEWSVREP